MLGKKRYPHLVSRKHYSTKTYTPRFLYHWEIKHDAKGAYVVGELHGRGWETSYITAIKIFRYPNIIVRTLTGNSYRLPIHSRLNPVECWRIV
jgi:hypothetical protein